MSGAQMTDRRARPKAPGQRVINLVGDHRVNDLSVGHVGRLSYIPRPDFGASGALHFNRTIDQAPVFQEVSPFEEWYPPTKSKASQGGEEGRREAKISQKAWLLKTLPDAFMGNADLALSLSEKARPGEAAQERSQCSCQPLLSRGEITDTASTTTPVPCPALAMAVGVSGHILRVVRLEFYDWRWAENEDVSLRLGTAESTDEGHWCGDSVAISQVKFVVHHEPRNSIRWLLVQKTTATIVFEPKLHAVPVSSGHHGCSYRPKGPSYISVNPVITLKTDRTGASPQCDVTFKPPSGPSPPQLIIIDQSGNWSVWDIVGTRAARHKDLSPVLWRCGNFANGPSAALSPAAPLMNEAHRIMWLAPSTRLTKTSKAPPSPLSDSNALSESRPGMLLLCDGTMLKILDSGNGQLLRTLNMVRQNKADAILDLQPHPGNSTQVFVLTTTSVFWIDVAHGGDSRTAAPPDGSDEEDDEFRPVHRPTVLASCPHLREQDEKTLMLSVATSVLASDDSLCLVCIHSFSSPDISMLWFGMSKAGGLANIHRQNFRFSLSGIVPGDKNGLQTVLVDPRSFFHGTGDQTPGSGHEYVKSGFRFLQVTALGADLALWSSLCATSGEGHEHALPPTIKVEPIHQIDKREAYLKYFSSSFVVPEDFKERFDPGRPQLQVQAQPRSEANSRNRPSVIDLSLVVELLSTALAAAVDRINTSSEATLDDGPFRPIFDEVGRRFENGQLPLRTLLEVAGTDLDVDYEADMMGPRWAGYVQQLRNLRLDRVEVMDLGRGEINPDAAGLHQALTNIRSVGLPQGASEERAGRSPQSLITLVVARLFLSQTGVLVAPQRVLPVSTQESQNVKSEAWPATSDEEDATSSAPPRPDSDDEQGEDATISRLRRYIPSVKTIPRRTTESRLLSNWQLGSDPSEYSWSLESPSQNVAEQLAAKRAKEKARQRRRAERLGLQRDADPGGPATQPIPQIAHSSQPQEAGSQRSLPSQIMSQPQAGTYGARPKKQKKKKVGGFK